MFYQFMNMTAWLMWKCSVTALPGTCDPDKVNAVLMHIEGPFYPCDQFGAFTQGPSLQCYRTPAEALISDQSISVALHTTERGTTPQSTSASSQTTAQ